MTLYEAFGSLIQKRGWHQNSGMIRQAAVRDKRQFLLGHKIPEERIRGYLRAAGWELIQEEQWSEIQK